MDVLLDIFKLICDIGTVARYYYW